MTSYTHNWQQQLLGCSNNQYAATAVAKRPSQAPAAAGTPALLASQRTAAAVNMTTETTGQGRILSQLIGAEQPAQGHG